VKFKADLHIHTVLSPCGDLEMSPAKIIDAARAKGLNIVGITDHNSTLNAITTAKLGENVGIFVMCGAEITTREEVHCLCFMPNYEALQHFQNFINSRTIFFPSNPDKFGFQLVVDKEENIIEEIPNLLINALDCGIDELQKVVRDFNGIFMPAHVDRPSFSLSSQLGFVPDGLRFEAMELSKYVETNGFFSKFPWFKEYKYVKSSDAHFINDIGFVFTEFEMECVSFDNIRQALSNKSFCTY
jgi:3',5'-nucleoside bisphosphate phosphatase